MMTTKLIKRVIALYSFWESILDFGEIESLAEHLIVLVVWRMTVNFCHLALPAIPFKCHYWVEISVSWKWERPVIWPQRAIWSFKNMNKCTGPPVTDNAAWISTKAFPIVFEPALSKAEAYEQRSREGACNSGSIKVRITYVFPFWWGAMRVVVYHLLEATWENKQSQN